MKMECKVYDRLAGMLLLFALRKDCEEQLFAGFGDFSIDQSQSMKRSMKCISPHTFQNGLFPFLQFPDTGNTELPDI